ncbi:receptor-like protein kinase FERONIA [Tanacetum coccineum]
MILMMNWLLGRDDLEGYHLHKARAHSNWVQLVKTAIGVGCGLAYLHTDDDTKQVIIHRDVKSANILLDENLRGMILDFGLSKISSTHQSFVLASVKGTFRYLDPEYLIPDVDMGDIFYAFRVVLFELLSGRLLADISELEMQVCFL